MVDAVETFCNVCIQYIFRLMHDLFEYVLNGIMAASAGAEAVAVWFKPGFPVVAALFFPVSGYIYGVLAVAQESL